MRPLRLVVVAALAAPAVSALSACAPVTDTGLPRCGDTERLGLVAQSVPTASYVPCLMTVPTGWRSSAFTVQRGSMSVQLSSDRAAGTPVSVDLHRSCDVDGAAPYPPRTAGGRTFLLLRSVSPRFAGTLFDAFPGGCVRYRFDFARGPHIALMQQLGTAVGFVSRDELRLRLRHDLEVRLGR